MNALQTFVASTKPECGFLSKDKLAQLIAIERLCPVLVRCGGCRFTCAAQDVATMIRYVEAGGDYVRDISLPTTTDAYAAAWLPAAPWIPAEGPSVRPNYRAARRTEFCRRLGISEASMERDYGGAFDGNTVTSDADPGL